MDDYFTTCQYKTEKPKNIEISALTSLGFDCFGVKQACFP